MRKGFRPTLEAPASRRVNLDGRRPLFCVVMTTSVICLIAAIFAVSAWSLHQHKFGHNQLSFHQGDQVSLAREADDLTAVFCDGYQVTLEGQDDAAYLLRHHARINQSLIATSSFDLHHIPTRRYTFLEVYLLPGSTLEVAACRENGSRALQTQIILIKGASNFNKWTLNTRCESCIFDRVSILPTVTCRQHGEGGESNLLDILPVSEIVMNVTLEHTDRYMLVVNFAEGDEEKEGDHATLSKGDNIENMNNHNRKAGVIVSGVFNRTRYDTENAGMRCEGKQTCDFDLKWGTYPDVIVDFEDPRGRVGEVGQDKTVLTKCRTRYGFWLLVFLGGPLFLAVPVAGIFSWFLCRRSRKPSMKRLSRQSERRVRADDIVSVRDDKGLVRNEVVPHDDDDDGCMTIQDD